MSLPLMAARGNSAGVCLRDKSQSHHSTRGARQRDLPGKTGEEPGQRRDFEMHKRQG